VDVLSNKVFPHLHADHTLDVALRRIAETGWKVLPVVSRDNLRQWKGTISLEDILAAYGVSAPQPQSEPHQPEAQQR
jgi:CBS domain-containing protein